MKIDPEKCIACLECVDFCPMNCIAEKDDAVLIDQDCDLKVDKIINGTYTDSAEIQTQAQCPIPGTSNKQTKH